MKELKNGYEFRQILKREGITSVQALKLIDELLFYISVNRNDDTLSRAENLMYSEHLLFLKGHTNGIIDRQS